MIRRNSPQRRFDRLSSGSPFERLEDRHMLDAGFQYQVNPFNVDGNIDEVTVSAMTVSAMDALLIVNELNHPRLSDPLTGALPAYSGGALTGLYLDVNGDRIVSALDWGCMPVSLMRMVLRKPMNSKSIRPRTVRSENRTWLC